ncbi:MAG TPA: hypothetical protein VND92_07170, partial [Vicinamibacterales bacterium]|nr:hypothetical protein [Vicinamibacterales bacterium]
MAKFTFRTLGIVVVGLGLSLHVAARGQSAGRAAAAPGLAASHAPGTLSDPEQVKLVQQYC